MQLRAKLTLSFLGLAVVPLTAITLYSYNSSLRALQSAAEEELSSLAADMGSRMDSVSNDLNRQLERFAALEVRRVMAMNKKDNAAAMQALANGLKSQMGDNVSFLKSLRFTPVTMPQFQPLPPPQPQAFARNETGRGESWNGFTINLSGEGGPQGSTIPGNDKRLPLPPFPRGRFDTEVRSGNELVGKVSAEISSRRLLYHVLMRTQPRQSEIPFAMDADGKLYATNPEDLKKIDSLPFPRTGTRTGNEQQIATLKNWVLVMRRDSQSGLTFGIARPIGDRLGDLRRTTVRNLGYGLAMVGLALVGIIPLSSRMTRNLTVLTKEAENLARGNLTARVPVTSKDEFGTLARTFNRMAHDLSENQKHLVEQERMHKELEMCRRIQEELLPRHPLRAGLVEVKGLSIPAQEVGGDFFNYFPMPGGSMALLIGDVSGKGLPAALFMANLQATIQARLPLGLDLVTLSEQLNSEIVENNSETYLTLFLAVLDPQSLKLRYINAGHNPQFLLHSDGSVHQLQSTGRPIGLLKEGDFEEKSVLLKSGDCLFFYTDGLVETANAAGEEFGMNRLETLLVEERGRGLDNMLVNIESSANTYRGLAEAADDATMMLLKIGTM